ncbi:MAG: hypothetical protein ABIU29_02030 [Chthoniobacterales bacterium]
MFSPQRFSRNSQAGALFLSFSGRENNQPAFQARELTHSPNNSLELTGSLANFDIVTIFSNMNDEGCGQ